MLRELIERCKERLGTYEKLSWALEVTPSNISDWKAGRKKPNTIQVMQMAEIVGFDKYQTLCLVMEEIDTKNAELWRKWRPYGDSHPGYRREKARKFFIKFMVIIFKFIPKKVNILRPHVNFQVLNERNAG